MIKKFLILLYFLLIANSTYAKNFNESFAEAMKLKDEKKYQESLTVLTSIEKDIDNTEYSIVNKIYFYVHLDIVFENYIAQNKDLWSDKNLFKEKISYLKKALEYLDKTNHKQKRNSEWVLDRLGQHYLTLYFQFGDNKKENLKNAEIYLVKLLNLHSDSLKKAKNTFGNDQSYYGQVLGQLMLTYRYLLEFDKALLFAKKELDDCLEYHIDNPEKCRDIESSYALVLGVHNPKEAIKIYKKLINEEKFTKKNNTQYELRYRSATRINLALIYLNDFDDFATAEKYMLDALNVIDLDRKVYLDDRGTYQDLVRIYKFLSIKDKKTAIKELKKIISELENFKLRAAHLSDAYSSLADIYMRDLDVENALKFYLKAESVDQYSPQLFGRIGRVYQYMGNYSKAEENFKKSLITEDHKYPIDNIGIAQPYLNLAFIQLQIKKYKEAENNLNKAMEVINNINQNHSVKLDLYSIYANLYSKKNLNEKIKFQKFILLSYNFINDNYSELVAKGFLNFKNLYKNRSTFQYNIDHLIENIIEADDLEQFLKEKSGKEINDIILDLSEKRRDAKINNRLENLIKRSENPKILNDRKELQDLEIEYNKAPKIADNFEDQKKYIEKLVLLKNEISNKKQKILSTLNHSKKISYFNDYSSQDIKNKLKKDQAIIAFYKKYLFLITDNQMQIKSIDDHHISHFYLESFIKNISSKIINTSKVNADGNIPMFDIKSSKELFNLLIDPIKSQIQDKKELIIIPDQSLLSIPFEILIDPEESPEDNNYKNQNWLGKKYAISYYPSLYSFYNLNQIEFKQAKNDFLGFGDPKFKSDKNIKTAKIDYTKIYSRGMANPEEIRKMSELPETKDELTYIANIFKDKSKLYLGKEFNENVVKSINLKDYKYISFATHAVIANQINNIAEPGLVLTPPDKSSKENERLALAMDVGQNCKIAFVQIAGLIARRIITDVEVGDELKSGDVFGLIRFGSRVDIYFPDDCINKVLVGQSTIAGETVIAKLNRNKTSKKNKK